MSLPSRGRRFAAHVLLAFASLVTVSATSATAPAHAQYNYASYCDFPVARYSQCPDNLTGRYAQNAAFYFGAGTVSVCQRGDYGSTLISRTCANNSTYGGSEYGYYYNNGLPVRVSVGNNSAYTHTIEGRAYVPVAGRGAATGSPETDAATPTTAMRRQFAVLARAEDAGPQPGSRTATDQFAVSANAADQICISGERLGLLTCNTVDNTVDGANQGIAICGSQLKEGTVSIYGVVPDGVASAELRGAKAGSRTVAVSNNTYAIDLPADAARGISSVVLHHADGSERLAPATVPNDDLGCS